MSTVTFYDAGDHISTAHVCRCCGKQFLDEIPDPQLWLDRRLSETASKLHDALMNDLPDLSNADDDDRRELVMDWLNDLGFNTREDGRDAILVTVTDHVTDLEFNVAGWIGAYDDTGHELAVFTAPQTSDVRKELTDCG